MKKIISVILAAFMTLSLCACGESDAPDASKIYDDLKSHVAENGLEDNYYIQISKTANSANTLMEASRLGDDTAFMEYDVSGTLKFFRNRTLTVITGSNFFIPEKTDAVWEDFEFESINEAYRSAFTQLIEGDAKTTATVEKSEDEKGVYNVNIQFEPKDLDTKTIFGNSGNFGIVSIKFKTDSKGKTFEDVTLSCQYDYDSIIFLYAVTFGDPNEPDEEGKNGQRPEDIKAIFKEYEEGITQSIAATE